MSWYEELDKWAADYLPDMEYEKDAPLDRYTSFRIGGPARRMAFPRSGEAAVLLVSHALELGARPFVLGNGTNVLFPDEGVERLVICTRDMAGVAAGAVAGEITAECGASLAKIAVFAQKAGLSGLEFAHGIPGSLGGAVCMNAGAYGGEMAQVVKEVTVLFPEDGVKTLSGEEMAFSYRHSLLTEHPDTVVLRATLHLQAGIPGEIPACKWSVAPRVGVLCQQAVPIGKRHFFPTEGLDTILREQHGHFLYHLCHFPTIGTGIHAHCAAQASRYPVGELQPGKPAFCAKTAIFAVMRRTLP